MSRGFTLFELLVAIAVVAILAGMLVPAVGRAMRTSEARAAWVEHVHRVRVHEIESPGPRPVGWPSWCAMTVDEAFDWAYPQYRSFADVPRSTVRYWRRERDVE